MKPELLDGFGTLVGALAFAEKPDGHLMSITGVGHEVGVFDVALLKRAKDLGHVAVGFQATDVDPEALGDLALLRALPRHEALFPKLHGTASGASLIVEGPDR